MPRKQTFENKFEKMLSGRTNQRDQEADARAAHDAPRPADPAGERAKRKVIQEAERKATGLFKALAHTAEAASLDDVPTVDIFKPSGKVERRTLTGKRVMVPDPNPYTHVGRGWMLNAVPTVTIWGDNARTSRPVKGYWQGYFLSETGQMYAGLSAEIDFRDGPITERESLLFSDFEPIEASDLTDGISNQPETTPADETYLQEIDTIESQAIGFISRNHLEDTYRDVVLAASAPPAPQADPANTPTTSQPTTT